MDRYVYYYIYFVTTYCKLARKLANIEVEEDKGSKKRFGLFDR